MANWFCGNVFASPDNVARCSFCVPTVIGDNGIAVPPAAIKRVGNSGAALISGINRARKDGSTIATGSGNIVSGGKRA